MGEHIEVLLESGEVKPVGLIEVGDLLYSPNGSLRVLEVELGVEVTDGVALGIGGGLKVSRDSTLLVTSGGIGDSYGYSCIADETATGSFDSVDKYCLHHASKLPHKDHDPPVSAIALGRWYSSKYHTYRAEHVTPEEKAAIREFAIAHLPIAADRHYMPGVVLRASARYIATLIPHIDVLKYNTNYSEAMSYLRRRVAPVEPIVCDVYTTAYFSGVRLRIDRGPVVLAYGSVI